MFTLMDHHSPIFKLVETAAMQGANCLSGVIHLLLDQWTGSVTPELQLLISDDDESAYGRLSKCPCLPRR